jgi:hypothetical protein
MPGVDCQLAESSIMDEQGVPPKDMFGTVIWSNKVVACPRCGKLTRLTLAASLRADWADALVCCPVRHHDEPLPDKPHFLQRAEASPPANLPVSNPNSDELT